MKPTPSENKSILPLIAVGGGGHCRSVLAAAVLSQRKVSGILDKKSPDIPILNIPYLGEDSAAGRYTDTNEFIITVGHIGKGCNLRKKIASHLDSYNVRWGKLISARAVIASDSVIREGSVILNNAVVNANVVIGRHVIINTGAIVEHDSVIEDFVHISTGAIINGGCHIGENTFVGSGTVIIQGINVCADVTIGAGAVVIKEITEPGIYAGNPCRKIK